MCRAARILVVAVGLAAVPTVRAAVLRLGLEEQVQAGGSPIAVLGYSVPSFADWDGDGLEDLIVGEGSGSYPAKVRVYLNSGTVAAPHFTTSFYAQSNGADLVLVGSGCMGLFPRVIYWDADARKDLLVGQADGKVRLYLNVGMDTAPTFDGGVFVQVGPIGAKTAINVGGRATPTLVDWNNDGPRDLVIGALDGRIRVFINAGTNTEPDFRADLIVQANGGDLLVPSTRASPEIHDFDGDGRKDILTGNYNGQLLLYSNVGTDAAPSFTGYATVAADGAAIDLAGTPRSRPFVCDWTGNGPVDVLLGSGDGTVRLYQSVFATGDSDCDGRVSFDDINAFVAALVGHDGYHELYPECDRLDADCNGDRKVDFDDINPFVEILVGSPG